MPNTKVIAKRNPPKKSASITIMNDKPIVTLKEKSRFQEENGQNAQARSIFASSTGKNGLTPSRQQPSSSSRPSVKPTYGASLFVVSKADLTLGPLANNARQNSPLAKHL